jgi:flagellar basal body rod protein FlgF
MDRLLYVAMTGAKQLMQAQTLTANNLANIGTTGFRADLARFQAEAIQGPGHPSRVNTVASGLGFDRSQGTLVETGAPLDVAIDGAGWLAVQAADGSEAYSRGCSPSAANWCSATTARSRCRRTRRSLWRRTARCRSCLRVRGRRRSRRSAA